MIRALRRSLDARSDSPGRRTPGRATIHAGSGGFSSLDCGFQSVSVPGRQAGVGDQAVRARGARKGRCGVVGVRVLLHSNVGALPTSTCGTGSDHSDHRDEEKAWLLNRQVTRRSGGGRSSSPVRSSWPA